MTLLQVGDAFRSFNDYYRSESVGTNFNALLAIGAIILIVLGGWWFARNGSRYSAGGLRKLCKDHGLGNDQYQLLKKACKDFSVTTPEQLFINPRYLNGILRRAIRQVSQSNAPGNQKEYLKGQLFEAKRLITVNHKSAGSLTGTSRIQLGQEVTIFSKTFPPAHSRVSGKTEDTIMLEHPYDSRGELVQFKPGSRIKVRLIQNSETIYSFVSTVKSIDEIEGHSNLLLPHTGNIQRIQMRSNRRKPFAHNAFFYAVNMISEGRGRKTVRRAVVDRNKRLRGTFVNISPGGCCIMGRSVLPKGAAVLIQFDIEPGKTIQVYGWVRSLSKERNGILFMHIEFSKISLENRNKIFELVYELNEARIVRENNNRALLL